MKRADYKFDTAVAAIVDDEANEIRLGSTELDFHEDDPIFSYLQSTSTVRDLRYAIQELRLDQNSECQGKRFKNPAIYAGLITYAESKIHQLNHDNAWFRNALKRLGYHFNSICRYAFLLTYEFDGYDSNSENLTTALGGINHFIVSTEDKNLAVGASAKTNANRYSSLGLYLASFFGFPSRPSGLNQAENYHLSFRQLIRNFFGGWNPLNQPTRTQGYIIHSVSGERKDLLFIDNSHFDSLEFKGFPPKGPDNNADIYPWSEWTAKKVLELFALPLKVLIIFPLKILMIPIKFLVNTAKLVTEFIPFVLSLILLESILILSRKRASDDHGRLVRYGYSILIGISAIFFAVFKIWHLLGRAFSSPTKSARRAYAYFSDLDSFKFRLFGKKFEQIVSRVVGVFFMLLSLTVSITLWTLLLPFAFSYLAPYATTLTQTAASTFPTIAKTLSTVAQWPALSVPLNAIGSALTAVGSYLSSTVALSTTFTFLSSFLSVQLPAYFVAAAVAIGTIIVPALTFFNWVANKLSDLWAYWGSSEQLSNAHKNDSDNSETTPSLYSEPLLVPGSGVKNVVANQAALDQQSKNASKIGNYFNDLYDDDTVVLSDRSGSSADLLLEGGLDSSNDNTAEIF